MSSSPVIAKNALFLSLRMVVVMAISIYTSRVFINVLGVEDYGISGVVGGFISMLSFLSPTLANGIQRFYNFEIGKGNSNNGVSEVYTSAIIIQLAWAVILILVLETIGVWYINNKMVIPVERLHAAQVLFQISMVSVFFGVMVIPYSSAVMAYEKMDYYALVSIIDVALKLAFAFTIPYVPIDKLISFGLFVSLTTVLNFILYYLYAHHKFKSLRIVPYIQWKRIKEMLSFSGWNLFGSVSLMARGQGVNMVLNLFFGPVVNAARSVAMQVSNAVQGLVANLSIAVKPQMTQSFAGGNTSRSLQLMYSMSKLSFLIMLVFGVPIIVEVDFLLRVWLGNAIPEHADTFIIWTIVVNIINNLHAQLSNMVFSIGKLRNYEVSFAILNILILPLSYIALMMGAEPEITYLIYFIVMIITLFVSLHVLSRLIDFSIKVYIRNILLPLIVVAVSSIVFTLIPVFLMPQGWLRLFVSTGLCLITSLPTFYFIGLDKKEKELVVMGYRVMKNKLRRNK